MNIPVDEFSDFLGFHETFEASLIIFSPLFVIGFFYLNAF